MKKSTLYVIALSAISFSILFLGSCTPHGDGEPSYNELQLKIQPKLKEFKEEPDTRGEKAFETNTTLGLFVMESGKEPVNTDNVYNRKYTYNGSSWNTDSEVYWPEGDLGLACKMYAYSPYSPTMADYKNHVFDISNDQSTRTKMFAGDFLYGKTLVNKQSEAVDMSLSHLFAMVTVNIKYAQGVGDICSGMTINGKTSAYIHLNDGTVIIRGGSSPITPAQHESAPAGYAKSFSAILPPQNFNQADFLTLKLDKGEQNVKVTKDLIGEHHYIINVTVIGEQDVVIDDIYVTDWDNKVTVNGGSIDEVTRYYTGSVIEYQKKRNEKPVTMIVLGDGFTKAELMKNGLFEQKAGEAIEFLFGVEPFKTYRDYFNIYFIAAESNQTGADNTSPGGTMRDTYFDTGWNDSYSDMGADENKVFSFAQKYCPDLKENKTTINDVVILLLVNDTRYGGICWSWNTGKCYVVCPLIAQPLNWSGIAGTGTSTGDWRNVVLHEGGGHGFGKLGDEYWYDDNAVYKDKTIPQHYWPVPFDKNLTADISATTTSMYWKHMIGDSRFPRINHYEGGMYCGKGIWRPEKTSCMIDNRRYFNAYSRQLIVERIMSLAGEKFNYDEFLAKDVNYDELQDGNKSGVIRQNFAASDIKIYPPLPPPVLIDHE